MVVPNHCFVQRWSPNSSRFSNGVFFAEFQVQQGNVCLPGPPSHDLQVDRNRGRDSGPKHHICNAKALNDDRLSRLLGLSALTMDEFAVDVLSVVVVRSQSSSSER